MNPDILNTYCERTQFGLWQEPFNLLSNFAFIVSAILAFGLYRNSLTLNTKLHWDLLLLIALISAIGFGSGLWHLVPNRFTMLTDVIPILLFMNIYVLIFFHRTFGIKTRGLILVFLLFLLSNIIFNLSFPADVLNGSIFYGPGWIVLICIGSYLYAARHPLHGPMLAAGGIFTAALAFRTIDWELCQWIPIGTHFIWHVLNAWLLYLITSALISQEAKRRLATT